VITTGGGCLTTDPSESKPVAQRWLPQTSLRFFVGLIAVCALGMYIFRSAIVGDQLWAKCAAAVLATGIGCFVAYLLLFLLADLFSTAASPLAALHRAGDVGGPETEVDQIRDPDVATHESQGNPWQP
jgi:hypothetical protein